MTLVEVAARFEAAGIAEHARALRSLQRCKPGRPPVYRDGDLYHLDPHDDELDLWMFRLDLRPPKIASTPRKVPEPVPRASSETALDPKELDEAWREAHLFGWSAQRLAIAVLDAHGGPLTPAETVAAVARRTRWHGLKEDSAKFKRRGSAVEVLADGRWAVAAQASATVMKTRAAVRDRVDVARRYAAMRPDPADLERQRAQWRQRRAARAAELEKLSRALIVAFPPARPESAALLDVGKHELWSFVKDELAALPTKLATYDVLGGIDVRRLLRNLDFDPGPRRLAELGPPQKTKKLNQRGRMLKITTAMLVQGSCGIGKPFGEKEKLAGYLATGQFKKLRRRLEADVKSLGALYEYGRLHGAVRLRWGFIDECIPAPWVDRAEPVLYDLMASAHEMGLPLEVVVGSAPGWSEPWSRLRRAYVEQDDERWRRMWLVDEDGVRIDEADVQRARIPVTFH